jgi:excisionase family DNA binding protein
LTVIDNIVYIDVSNEPRTRPQLGGQMKNELPEVMTLPEMANYLRIPKSSLYKLAQVGKIPCQKVGRHWRFRRKAIDVWLEQMRNQNPAADLNIKQELET